MNLVLMGFIVKKILLGFALPEIYFYLCAALKATSYQLNNKIIQKRARDGTVRAPHN